MWKAHISSFGESLIAASPLVGGMTSRRMRITDEGGVLRQLAILLFIPVLSAFATAYVTQAVMGYKLDEQAKKLEEYRAVAEKRADKLDELLLRMQQADQNAQLELNSARAEHRIIMQKIGLRP